LRNDQQENAYRAFVARWIVPVATPPIENGVIIIDDNRIIEVGERSILNVYGLSPTDLGEVVIFPGLVNCHIHLEQGYKGELMPNYRRYQQELLFNRVKYDYQQALAVAEQNVAELRRYGVVALADFSYEGASYQSLLQNNIYARLFFEVSGFKSNQAEAIMLKYRDKLQDEGNNKQVTKHLAPSSVWATSPQLLRAISLEERHIAMHLNCHEAEEVFIRTGGGFLRQLLHAVDDFDYGWEVPACNPVEYFFHGHFYAKHNLLIHMTTTTAAEMDLMREYGVKVNICLCPRAAMQLMPFLAPVQLFMEKGFNLCLGSESKLLTPDFDLRQEMRLLVDKFGIMPEQVLKFATLNGAYAIGFHKEVGSLEPGKTADCLVVDLPTAGKQDPFEAIVYSPQPVRWLTSAALRPAN
jgi:5-methylthioadenosine/S-adenosylhomocysteine deaminase